MREGHPLLEGEITAERYASFSHISMSRRGIARGPIDTALNALGLERRVALIAPSFHAAMFVLPDSDLILPVPKEALLSISRLGLRLRSFTLPINAADPDADSRPGTRATTKTRPSLVARDGEGQLCRHLAGAGPIGYLIVASDALISCR